ncbi:Serine protease family S33 [Phytophthora cinnamomi]|uniref:Serine protease family S33 n=1 Tax=Phytophthora cinnamomi TaxID=4785 RepID=UPI003559B532|nr:Serine protease family S33 [Phytophthora cinnamomi]
MSGKLDPQTPHKYAEYLLEALRTSQKELVTFNYSTHDTVSSTPLNDSRDPGVTCGMKLLASYISNNGDLKRLDRSCVSQMPAFNLTVPSNHVSNFFSTDDVYDGMFQAGSSSN